MCRGLEDFQLLRKYSEKHHTNLQKKHTAVARDMQLQERSLVRERSKEERRAECKKQPQSISFHLSFGDKIFHWNCLWRKKFSKWKCSLRKASSFPVPTPQPKQSFVEETPKLAGLGFRAKLGSPFFMQWAVLVWNSSHVMEANNQHGLGGDMTSSGKRAVEGRTHWNHMQLRKSPGCKWFGD